MLFMGRHILSSDCSVTFQSPPIVRLLVSMLDSLGKNICCCCESFGAQTLHNVILADLQTKLIEMIGLWEYRRLYYDLIHGKRKCHLPTRFSRSFHLLLGINLLQEIKLAIFFFQITGSCRVLGLVESSRDKKAALDRVSWVLAMRVL